MNEDYVVKTKKAKNTTNNLTNEMKTENLEINNDSK